MFNLPAASPPKGIHHLTPAELRIIRRIVATDDKYSAIWQEMGIGARTFNTHLDSIYTKLGTRKRSGLVREAVQWGLG